jgi:hypothetical protein
MFLDSLNRLLEWPFKIRAMITFAVMMGHHAVMVKNGSLPNIV